MEILCYSAYAASVLSVSTNMICGILFPCTSVRTNHLLRILNESFLIHVDPKITFFCFSHSWYVFSDKSAQGFRNRFLAVHKRVDSRFLGLAGSESIFTEIIA